MGNDISLRSTLQIARMKFQTDINGDGYGLIKAPTGGRSVYGGTGWFDTPHADDVVYCDVTDEDNTLGYGAGFVVKSYVDLTTDPACQGWYIPPQGYLDIRPIAELATIPENLYLKIIVKKGDGSQDWFRCNINWGTVD